MMILFSFADFAGDLFVNVIASILCTSIGVLAGYLIEQIKEKLYKRKVRRTLRFKVETRKAPLVVDCYYANSGNYDSEEAIFYGFPFEYMASASFHSYLDSVNKKSQMNSSPAPLTVQETLALQKNNNMLILGGPFHNLLTCLIFGMKPEYTNVPFYFDDFEGEPATLHYVKDGEVVEKFKPIYSELLKEYTDDYGIIMNIKNPFNTDKRIIAIIGCRSIGVYGAATYFSLNAKEIAKNITADEYAIVIKCHGDKDNLDRDPELCFSCKLDSIDMNQIKEQMITDLPLKNDFSKVNIEKDY